MKCLKLSIALTLALFLAGPVFAVADQPFPSFITTIAADHPLSGQIFDVQSGMPVSPDALVDAMAKADIILLGEKHDNADHHAVQAWAYDALLAAGRRPALLYEMIGEDQQPKIAGHRSNRRSLATLGNTLDWENSGWPDWSLYAPMAISAGQHNLPILGANLPKSLTRPIYSEGPDVLGTERADALGLNLALPPPITDALLDDVEAGHCGLMPRESLSPMVMVQRARDAVMADNAVRAGRAGDGAVLIAGNGHARRDHGVPWVMNKLAPEFTIISLAILEVQDSQTSLEDYHEDFGGSLPYDFVLFTPRANNRDYCAELKASMGKKEN